MSSEEIEKIIYSIDICSNSEIMEYDFDPVFAKLRQLEVENEGLKEDKKKYLFMIENGLGFEDFERDIGGQNEQ